MADIPVWDLKSQFNEYQNKQNIFDCMLAEFLLAEGRYPITEEEAVTRHKASSLADLAEKQQLALEKNPKLLNLFQTVEMPLVPVLWSMEQEGITLDGNKLQQIEKEVAKQVAEIQKKIYAICGKELNLSSPQQVGTLLVETFHVPLKKKPSGSYGTSEPELAKFAEEFPIVRDLLTFRGLAKLSSTYLSALQEKIGSDGRVHTTYNQAGATTGRLSSSNPNLQNIPTTSEIGLQIKSCFIAAPGNLLISADYSQQELRILAHVTEEEALIKAFQTNRDIHKVTAANLFHTTYEAVTDKQRSAAKTINFGLIYGMSSFGLAQTLQISDEEADKFIKAFFQSFPKVKQYFDTLLTKGKQTDYIETIMGRRRFVFPPGQRFIDNASRRVLINFPIQGSAADLTKLAMVKIAQRVVADQPKLHLLLQVHDELIFELEQSTPELLKTTILQIQEQMETAYPLSVPMRVDMATGPTWAGMSEYQG